MKQPAFANRRLLLLPSMPGNQAAAGRGRGAAASTARQCPEKPTLKAIVKGAYGAVERVESVTLKGDKVYVKFEGGDMTLTVSGGKASGQVSTIGAKGNSGIVSLTRQ